MNLWVDRLTKSLFSASWQVMPSRNQELHSVPLNQTGNMDDRNCNFCTWGGTVNNWDPRFPSVFLWESVIGLDLGVGVGREMVLVPDSYETGFKPNMKELAFH
ncbi:hypothetical protein QQP08_003498 [Theobroma cacao]|nr:hypothetical protein QQP08_003498 [Theobroma cacao]